MSAVDVKQGDVVLYAINGKEYNAVALGSASVGKHPGLPKPSVHLNLIYLNEQGTPIKIFGAPLLSSALDEKALEELAPIEDRVNGGVNDEGKHVVDLNAAVKRLAAAEVTIGWKPAEEGAAAQSLKASLASARAQVTELTAKCSQQASDLAAAQQAAEKANAQVEQLTAQVAALEGHVASVTAAAGAVGQADGAGDADGQPAS